MEFPLNINKSINENINSIEKDVKISENEKESVKEFMQYFSKEITIEECKKWKKDAAAFNYGISTNKLKTLIRLWSRSYAFIVHQH